MDDGTYTEHAFRGELERRRSLRSRLVGRSEILLSLSEAAQRAHGGSRTVVLLEADAGMGKTFLVDQLPPMFHRLGFEVLSVVHDRLATGRPLSGFLRHIPVEFLDEETAISSSLFAFVNRSNYDIIQRFAAFLEAKSADHPIAIVVDDVQFADLSTVHLIDALIRRLDGLPVLFVLASRVAQRPEVVDALFGALPPDATIRHRLGTLTEDSISALAADRLGRSPTAAERAVLARSGGSPLFVQALMDRLCEGNVDLNSLSPEFRQFVLDQIAPLPSETRRTLEMASLAERGFTLSELSALTGYDSPSLWGYLREVLEQGMLVETDTGFDFRHDLVKSAIYEELSCETLRKLHLHAAEVLVRSGGDPVQIANHFVRGDSDAGIDCLPWLRLAARRLAGHDASEALRMIEFASERCPPEHPDRALIAAEQVYALCWADRFGEAVRLVDASLPLATTSVGRVELHLSKARALLASGQALAAGEALGQCLEEHPDREQTQFISALRGLTHFMAGDHSSAESFMAPLIQSSDVAPLTAALANLVQSQAHSSRLEIRQAQTLMKRALAIAERDTTGEIAGYVIHNFRFYVANNVDDLEEMANSVRDGRRTAERKGLNWSLPMYHGSEAMRFREMGSLDDALAEAETGLRVAEETKSALGAALCVAVASWVHLRRGNVELARQVFDGGQRWRTSVTAAVGLDELLLVESGFALEAGDTDKAKNTLEFMWDYIAAGNLEIFARGILMPYLRLVVQSGDAKRVSSILEVVENWRDRSASELPTFAALWLQARGVGTGSLDDMKASLEIWRRSWRRIRFADALVDGVGVAAGAGAKNLSKSWAAEAEEIYREAGADGSLLRLKLLGRDLGMAERSVKKLGRPMTGWSSLSPAEIEVAKLVASGASNRGVAEHLLVSHRTIETHLSHVFAKLQVSSRRELGDRVRSEASALG
jgi:DNA-binding CsgD family transcriptional regulator